mmetsp:Transcript_30012/g.64284  ORF Transcript_30012/g.64284 Transcript_30012/m.64284 type:complete len:239 (-) Transcript_30012:31-747(-)
MVGVGWFIRSLDRSQVKRARPCLRRGALSALPSSVIHAGYGEPGVFVVSYNHTRPQDKPVGRVLLEVQDQRLRRRRERPAGQGASRQLGDWVQNPFLPELPQGSSPVRTPGAKDITTGLVNPLVPFQGVQEAAGCFFRNHKGPQQPFGLRSAEATDRFPSGGSNVSQNGSQGRPIEGSHRDEEPVVYDHGVATGTARGSVVLFDFIPQQGVHFRSTGSCYRFGKITRSSPLVSRRKRL